jgi:hypothetical protein
MQSRSLGFFSLAKPASYSPTIVSGVAQFCFERRRIFDGILISGDLATTGMALDINAAKNFLSEPARAGFTTALRLPTLDATDLPIYVLPGNHDKYVNNTATPNCPNFELIFADQYMPNFTKHVGHKILRKRGHAFGFVYGDFCLRSRTDASDRAIGPYGQGRVYAEVLNEMKSRTQMLRRKYSGVTLIWIIHFAPFDCGWTLELIDGHEVIDAATKLGIPCTLCGHTHQARKLSDPARKHVVYCAGSAGCIDSDRDSQLHLFEFEVGDGLKFARHNFQWNDDAHQFLPIGSD